MEDTIIRLVKLPRSCKGLVTDSPDGTHNIYINDSLCLEMQRETYRHELRHIEKDHLNRDMPVQKAERETK